MEFELYSTDLTEEAQERLLKAVGEHNYDVFPLCIIEIDDDADDEEE